MHRVLKPNGRLLFVEHGLAPEPGVRWWQDHFTPLLFNVEASTLNDVGNRSVEMASAGTTLHLDTAYMGGPKPMTFMYEGTARPQ
jgi:hypothetical protein